MSKPSIEEKLGIFNFSWEEDHLQIKVSRIRMHRDSRVTGEIRITTDAEGYAPLLHQSQINFTSANTMKQFSNLMLEKYPASDWPVIIEQLCYHTLDRIRQGEPVQELYSSDDVNAPGYLLNPIMPLNQPTIIFGEPGVGKTEIALVCLICLMLPWFDNPLRLHTPNKVTKVLFLDYEGDSQVIQWRLKCLQEGMKLPPINMYYRRCHLPLAEDIEQIQEAMTRVNAESAIIDSLAAAVGGDLKEAGLATNFFTAERQLKSTNLIVAQTSKDLQAKSKTIFGSAIFQYYARSIWEVRKIQEPGENEVSIALFHRKANESKLHYPLGYSIYFNENKTTIKYQDVKSVSAFLEQMSNSAKILEELKEGSLSVMDLVERLGIVGNTARQTLKRLCSKGKVIKVDDKWGLSYGERDM